MTTPAGVVIGPAEESAWFQAGYRCAGSLGASRGAVVVLGRDPIGTACVALGFAQALQDTRRVAIVDLIGDVEPLRRLIPATDVPGILDGFVHGVSLNRIALPVNHSRNLFLLPSGSTEIATEEILGSPRWERLAKGFHEVGALLVIAVLADAPGAESLALRLGGALVAGTDVLLDPGVRTLATAIPELRAARERAIRERAARAAAGDGPPPAAPTAPMAPIAAGARVRRATPTTGGEGAGLFTRIVRLDGRLRVATLASLAVVLLVTGALLARDRRDGRDAAGGPAAIATEPASPAAAGRVPVATDVPLVVRNAADSALAVGFAVELVAANTLEGALLSLRDAVPAGTVSPELFGSARAPWFRVVAGAYATRRGADSLITELVRRRRLASGAGRVLRAPLAFVLREHVPETTAAVAVSAFIRQGLPAYALVQDDGTVTIFAGAFETLDQAALLVPTLRAARIAPAPAYRTGRVF